jgi:hypothetical protein
MPLRISRRLCFGGQPPAFGGRDERYQRFPFGIGEIGIVNGSRRSQSARLNNRPFSNSIREAGLITQYNHGKRAELTLRRADLESRFPWLLDLIACSNEQNPAAPPDMKATRKRPLPRSLARQPVAKKN